MTLRYAIRKRWMAFCLPVAWEPESAPFLHCSTWGLGVSPESGEVGGLLLGIYHKFSLDLPIEDIFARILQRWEAASDLDKLY